MGRSRRPMLVLAALVAAAVLAGAGAGRALTVSLGALTTKPAGIGATAVSAFTVSGVAYNRSTTSPQNVDSVTFTIGPAAATTVKIKFDGSVYACSGSTSVTCATTSPQAKASSAVANGSLVVVAAQ